MNQVFEFTIKGSDPEALKDVAETLNLHFGDAGTDETPEYYLERKAEEFIQQLYVNKKAERATQTTFADTARQTKEAAPVKPRKDKPVEEPKPGETETKKVFG